MAEASSELRRAHELAQDYLRRLDGLAIATRLTPDELRRSLDRPLTEEGVPACQVLEEMAAEVEPGLLHSANGRFFGWVIGGGTPTAAAADWLATVWNQNAAAYACSPAAATVEETTGRWLKDLFGLPSESSFAFVTGCQMAHVTALAAARHRMLARAGWSVERQGLAGSPGLRVLAGEHHETLLRALRLLGIGTDAVVQIDQKDDGTMNPASLARALERDAEKPTIVALAAGDLNRGAFDPIAEVCDLARRHQAWVHVDGAFGLWAATSDRFRHLVHGLEQADSWATDAHKWLNVPYDSGLVFVRDREAHRQALSIPAAYGVDVPGVRDQFEWGPEWSRRARGFAVYAALRTLGRQGVAALVDSCCDRARDLVAGLERLPGVEVLARPIINQGLVRFLDPAGDHDRHTEEVIERINASGGAWFGPTTWEGMRVMRISVSNARTTEEDIEHTIAIVRAALNS